MTESSSVLIEGVEEVPSPCNNICRMNSDTGYCEGCFRTLDEIAGWSSATRVERLAVLAKLDARRERSAARANPGS
jgi:predicted Fe-S protein YdhL (DUF1289 family)